MGSRLLPPVLATAALAAGSLGLDGLALWLGLALVPAAAAVAFVAVSDALEGRPALLHAVTSCLALALFVLASASRSSAPAGALATWALVLALLVYGFPFVAWVLEPVRMPRRTTSSQRRRRRLRPAEVDELLSRAA